MNLWLLMLFFAGQAGSGVVTGKVLHQQQPSRVVIQKDAKDVASGLTDAKGIYRFALQAGNYTMRVGNVAREISVAAEKTVTVDLDLNQPQFFDEPRFTVAGVTDNTYQGGHGSDNTVRSTDALTKETAALGGPKDTGNALQTVKSLQKAAEQNPSEPNLFNWGTELLSHKAPQAAAEVFSKGNSVRMILGQAAAWYAAGKYATAAHCFFEAIDMNPEDPKPYSFLVQARSEEIIQAPGYSERFERFLKLTPNSALANYYYGQSLLRQHKEALAPLKKAVELDPSLAGAQLALGIAYAEHGNYSEAIAAYQAALRQDPDLEEAHYRLSEAYRLTGDRADSARELATYQKLSATFEQQQRETQKFVVQLKNQ
jgi:tetratricopeptide (TPR) repeat protein